MLDKGSVMEAHHSPMDVESESVGIAAPADSSIGNDEPQLKDALECAANVYEIPVDVGEKSIPTSNELMSVSLSLFDNFEQSYRAQLEAQKQEKMQKLEAQKRERMRKFKERYFQQWKKVLGGKKGYNIDHRIHKSCIVTRIDYKKCVDDGSSPNTSSKLPKNSNGSNSLHAVDFSMLNSRSKQIDTPSASSFPSPTSCASPAVNLFNSDCI